MLLDIRMGLIVHSSTSLCWTAQGIMMALSYHLGAQLNWWPARSISPVLTRGAKPELHPGWASQHLLGAPWP